MSSILIQRKPPLKFPSPFQRPVDLPNGKLTVSGNSSANFSVIVGLALPCVSDGNEDLVVGSAYEDFPFFESAIL
jgi:hypothetical protein